QSADERLPRRTRAVAPGKEPVAMVDRQHPRRPAILDAAGAELIEGDVDPAVASELAHTTARVLVFGAGEDAEDAELAGRLAALVDREGLDSVAELWSRSPATTLPGALW